MFRPWWLDAVCPERWDVCLAFDQGGEVTGALVYHLTKYKGFPIIKMPPLTDYSGLWLNYPYNLQKPASRYAFAKQVSRELLQQLPNAAFFYQQWHPDMDNWLPFFWSGFRQTTLYTYRLEMTDNETLYSNLQKSARKNIAKAGRSLIIQKSEAIEDLYRLVELSFARQKLPPPYSLELLKKLDEVLKIRQMRTIYLAYDESGNLHAGVYLFWDERCAYSLISGADPDFRHSEGQYLVQWQSILDSIGRVESYDLCGSIIEPIEESLRSFGGTLTSHFKIFKARNKIFQLLSILLNKDFY